MKRIAMSPKTLGEGVESQDIRVTGARRCRSTHFVYIAENVEKHGFKALEGKLDSWVLFACQHATVIDNYGGSAAERERMTVELAVGEPFEMEGVEGVWMLADRDSYRFEGDGVKPVPYREES